LFDIRYSRNDERETILIYKVAFNKQMKALCRMAGIDEIVSGFKNNPKTPRKEIVNAPKYAFVTSPIMRCSFAFN
jgi:hypothetical protein